MYIILLLSSFELQLYLTYACSLIPRLSLPLEFDHLQYASTCDAEGGGLGNLIMYIDVRCIR